MSRRYGAAVLLTADYRHRSVFFESPDLEMNAVGGSGYKQPKEAVKLQILECGSNNDIFCFPELDFKKSTENLCQP